MEANAVCVMVATVIFSFLLPMQQLVKLHEVVQEKLDLASLRLMEQSELNIDGETFNLRVEAGIPQLMYCLWGNIVKNPR